jgi:hypothetical protein
LQSDRKSFGLKERLRILAWPAPFVVLIDTLFFKGCVLDGWHGWYYVLQRLVAEIFLALEMIDRRFRARVTDP